MDLQNIFIFLERSIEKITAPIPKINDITCNNIVDEENNTIATTAPKEHPEVTPNTSGEINGF